MTTSTPRFTRVFFGTGEGIGSGLPGLYGRNHGMSRHYDEGDGGGDGERAGDGGDGTGGIGDGDGGGDGDGQFYEFKNENQKFKFPGMAKAMTVKEYNAQVAKQTGTQAQTLAAQALGKILLRAGIDPKTGKPTASRRGQGESEGGGTPRRRASDKTPDPLAQLEGMDLVGGKDVAAVLRQAYEGNIAPLAQAVIALKKELNEVKRGVSPVVQDRDEQLFGTEVDGALKALKLPSVPGKNLDTVNAALKELARDVFFGYDDADRPKLKGETFAKLVVERYNLFKKAFKELDSLELEAARLRQRQRIFAKPGANTSVNGKPRPRLTNRDIANMAFDGTAPNT